MYKTMKDLLFMQTTHNFVPDSTLHSSTGLIPIKSSKTKYFTQNEPSSPQITQDGWILCTEDSGFALFKQKTHLEAS